MASGSHMALDEAADALGVSVAALERRIKRGDLPEATLDEEGYVLAADELPGIADREGWIIDIRHEADQPSTEFTEMLEQLLTLGNQLTVEVSARMVAEQTVEAQAGQLVRKDQQILELDGVIEELDVENERLAVDLQAALTDLAVADALATERNVVIADLQDAADAARRHHDQGLRDQRAQNHQLREQLQDAYAAMGWWSRRRLERGR